MSDFWSSLTQPQAMVVNTVITTIMIPLLTTIWVALWKLLPARREFKELQTEVAKVQTDSAGVVADAGDEAVGSGIASENWKELRDEWRKIRQKILTTMNDPDIDGRTRAKYKRFDLRYGYDEVIGALAKDGNLKGRLDDYTEAAKIWNQFRPNRAQVPDDALVRMRQLASNIAL